MGGSWSGRDSVPSKEAPEAAQARWELDRRVFGRRPRGLGLLVATEAAQVFVVSILDRQAGGNCLARVVIAVAKEVHVAADEELRRLEGASWAPSSLGRGAKIVTVSS